jgi:tetratricopeptide (TPR) repeat protein
MLKGIHKKSSLFLGLLIYMLITPGITAATTKPDHQSKGIFYAQSYYALWSELREFNQRQRAREEERARIEKIRKAQELARESIPELERKGDYQALGQAWRTLKEWDKSLDAANKAIAAYPNVVRGYTLRASLRKRLNDIPGAIADYDQAIAIEPDYHGYYRLRGQLKKSFDRNGAIQDFRMAMKVIRVDNRFNLIREEKLSEFAKELRSLGVKE